MLSRSCYVRDMRAVQVVGRVDNTTPLSSPAAHTSEVGAGKVGTGSIVGTFVDLVARNLQGEDVSVLLFTPQRYKSKDTWLTIFQVDVLRSPLRAVS